jgi:hypothetical protein
MTQNEKDLLFKDLCARLPYGVKCEVYNCIGVLDEVTTFYGVGVTYSNGQDTTCRIDECKPYLFPLSSMTDEQAKELFNIFGLVCPSTEEDYIKINECTGITFFLCQGFDVETHLDKLIDWLNKNHFDYRGLIPMDLANDSTGLNIY